MTEETTTKRVTFEDLMKSAGVAEEKPELPKQIKGEEVFAEMIKENTNSAPTEEVNVPFEELAKKEEVAPQTETKKEQPKKLEPTEYAKKLKELVSLGLVDDMEISIGEGDDEKKVHLSDFDEVDEGSFTSLLTQIKEAKEKDLKEKYISKEGLDERTQKYIELKKAGGDISKLIEQEVRYISPLSTYDLDNESHQEELIRKDPLNRHLHPKVMDAQIQAFKEDMCLDIESKKVYDRIQGEFNDYVETKKQEQIVLIEEEKKQDKEFRKGLNEELKHLIKDEGVQKLILDNSTKRDQNGLTNVDQLYYDAQRDPKKFAKIAFLLNNEEAFLKSVGAKVAIKELAKTTSTILKINPAAIKTLNKEQKIEDDGIRIFNEMKAKFNQ